MPWWLAGSTGVGSQAAVEQPDAPDEARAGKEARVSQVSEEAGERETGQEVGQRDGGADPQLTGRSGPLRGCRALQLVDRGQRPQGALEDHPPQGRRCQRPAAAVQERAAHLRFERLDLAGDRGLRAVEPSPGGADRALLDDHDEGA